MPLRDRHARDGTELRVRPHGTLWGAFVDDCRWKRGFHAIFTLRTPICGDNVDKGILGSLVPAP